MTPALRVAVTFFSDYAAQEKREESFTLAALAELIRTTSAAQKAGLPWLKLARFGKHKTKKASLRHDRNVIACCGIEADYDGEKIGFAEAVETLDKAGIKAVVYTSPSHTEEAPRWRVLCPFSCELPPDRRQHMIGRLNGLFLGAFACESWTLSQAYYFGAVANNPEHRVEVVDGTPIDLCDELDRIWLGKPDTLDKRGNGNGQFQSGPVDEAALLREVVSGASYHQSCIRLAGLWARQGVAFLDAQKRLYAAFDGVEAFARDARWHHRRDDVPRTIRDIYGKEAEQRDSGGTVDIRAPYDVARLLLDRDFTIDGRRTLHRHRGGFYHWSGTAYPEIDEAYLRSRLYSFLAQCETTGTGRAGAQPVKPNAAMIGNVLDALRAASHLDEKIAAPAWLDQVTDLPAEEIIACNNGLLHLPTLTLLRHSPAFFSHNALDFAVDPDSPEPRQWLAFLDQLWPDDSEAIETLQQIFGYYLTADIRQQKLFLIVGPKRSGKGTIARVLTRLVGIDNAVAPTLAGLGTNFGLAPLIGKRVAIISDARLAGRADQHAIAERLLSISGEDAITIDRKFREAWTGRLQTRFLILSNELPRLADASGALAARFIVLVLTNSFYGREDLGLIDRLLTELPGILNWSIAGWRRLTERGHFVQPRSARDAVQQLEDLASPIGAFIREECEAGSAFSVETTRIFEAWTRWCTRHGRDHPGTAQSFGRDLRAVLPGLKVIQPREGEGRLRYYQGLRLR
ncbi:MAG TPA: phage/plasmid primase, P4 family [Stellaceae bacterium]